MQISNNTREIFSLPYKSFKKRPKIAKFIKEEGEIFDRQNIKNKSSGREKINVLKTSFSLKAL